MNDPTLVQLTLRLAAALGLGAAIGLERELHHKPAGLRTYALVALGAAAFTLITLRLMHGSPASESVDPLRLVAGIVGGIGFLGAGAIFQRSDKVRGMTTAAGIWVVAAVGVASGAGYYMIAGVCVGFAVFTLVIVRWVEGHMEGSRKSR